MDETQIAIARDCLTGAYSDTMSFPDSLAVLGRAGFESYVVDYRRKTRTYYLPDGDSLELAHPQADGAVAAAFDAAGVGAAVRWAQSHAPDYSYAGFNARVTALGCAGYMVSLAGRRVVYFGRTGETHVEHMPR